MNKIHDVDYLYATARLRALEKNMLTGRDLEKMVDASTLEESYKIANDISLHSRLEAAEYEQAIGDMLSGAYGLVAELTGESEVLSVFRYKYDGHNLKVIIKSQSLGSDPLRSMSPLGTVPKEELLRAFRERRLDMLPERLANAAFEASEALAKSGNPQTVDIMIDRAVLECMLAKAEEIGFPFLTGLVQSQIDIENIRTAVRLKRMKQELPALQRLFLDGGTLDAARLYEAFEAEGFDAMRDMLYITRYYTHFAPLFDTLSGRGSSLTAFEKGAENYIISLLKGAKLVAFGLEPVISYLLGKENEAKDIRIVLASKEAGVESKNISERLRDTYA